MLINDLVQDIAVALELLQFCTKLSILIARYVIIMDS